MWTESGTDRRTCRQTNLHFHIRQLLVFTLETVLFSSYELRPGKSFAIETETEESVEQRK